jgi:hypothetical protein
VCAEGRPGQPLIAPPVVFLLRFGTVEDFDLPSWRFAFASRFHFYVHASLAALMLRYEHADTLVRSGFEPHDTGAFKGGAKLETYLYGDSYSHLYIDA